MLDFLVTLRSLRLGHESQTTLNVRRDMSASTKILLLQLASGEISPQDCRTQLTQSIVDYTTDPDYLEDSKVEVKARRIRLMHSRLFQLIDELESIH